jgi:hypothetical protein
MELEFENYALTIDANNLNVPDLTDDNLYTFVKDNLIQLLKSNDCIIIHFGYAPDNTADNNDELLNDGVYYRIIAQDRYLGIDLDSDEVEVKKAFCYLVENFKPFWSSIIIENGFIKSEKTIELLYKEL